MKSFYLNITSFERVLSHNLYCTHIIATKRLIQVLDGTLSYANALYNEQQLSA